MARRRFSAEPHAPKYQQVFESLSKDLLSGKYQPGQKFPSEAALVQQFGTSRITIGRAVRELTQRGMVERVAGSGTYVRHSRATENGFVFGLLIPDLGQTEIFEPICRGIATAPQASQHALLWGHTTPGEPTPEEQALQLCDQYIGRRVSGVFFAPIETGVAVQQTNLTIVSRLEEAHIPIVLLDRCVMPYPSRVAHDLVGIDNRRAGYMAAEHLLKLGTKRISMVAHSGGAPTVEARIAGFREAVLARRATMDECPVCRLDAIDEASVRVLLANSADGEGFVCANDRTAGRLMQAVLGLGYRIPDDIRIVGIDDVEYASLLPVPLTTVHQPCREIGEAAMAAMLDRVARPKMYVRDVLVECHMVIRASCGAGRK
jgi:GntR family transcriptional regulator, arabinose operon transcriptional repressor